MSDRAQRRLPCGAEIVDGGVHARVWAPACKRVDVVLDGSEQRHPLEREADGHYSGVIEDAGVGTQYRFLLDGERLRADPCSRFQPDGPHGVSEVVDPAAFNWSDTGWHGIGRDGQIIYEMHVGTFTPGRTWQSAAEQFPHLARLGITVIEMMPIAEFPGRFGWGYDGVRLYAPCHLYGRPDDLRTFVDQAHAHGLAVILDVVYNHLGPDGNFLAEFSPDYFTDKYKNDWGRAVNFEGPAPAREHFVANAGYWIDEYHFDGLRLDATQNIQDESAEHVLQSITTRVRAAAAGRRTYVIGENEPQDTRLVRPLTEGGFGMDALWNDDFHHTAVVALTGRRQAYYHDYQGSPQELISSAKYGFLYQGQCLRVAEEGARHAGVRAALVRLRHVSRESRPGRQLGVRSARAHLLVTRTFPRDDGTLAARSGNTAAVPGTGVQVLRALPLLCRSQSRTAGTHHSGPP